MPPRRTRLCPGHRFPRRTRSNPARMPPRHNRFLPHKVQRHFHRHPGHRFPQRPRQTLARLLPQHTCQLHRHLVHPLPRHTCQLHRHLVHIRPRHNHYLPHRFHRHFHRRLVRICHRTLRHPAHIRPRCMTDPLPHGGLHLPRRRFAPRCLKRPHAQPRSSPAPPRMFPRHSPGFCPCLPSPDPSSPDSRCLY